MNVKNVLLVSFLSLSLQPTMHAMEDEERKALFNEIELQTCALNMASEWREEDLHKSFVEAHGEDGAERILNAFIWPSCECILQKKDADTCDAIFKKEAEKQLLKEYEMKQG